MKCSKLHYRNGEHCGKLRGHWSSGWNSVRDRTTTKYSNLNVFCWSLQSFRMLMLFFFIFTKRISYTFELLVCLKKSGANIWHSFHVCKIILDHSQIFLFEFLSSEISEIICHFSWSRILKSCNFGASKIFLKKVTTLFYNFSICGKSICIQRTNSGVRTTFRNKVSAEKLKFSPATYRIKITMFKY